MTRDLNRQRRIDIIVLFMIPMFFILIVIGTMMGMGTAEHSKGYIINTALVLAAISVILPLFRVTGILWTPYWFIGVITSLMYLHSLSLYIGTYMSVSNWDVIAHMSSSIVLTMIVFVGLCAIQTYTKRVELGYFPMLFMTLFISYGFGNVWEMVEWAIDNGLQQTYMSYSVYDTLRDILSDFVGATIAVVGVALVLRRKGPDGVMGDFGFERFMSRIAARMDRTG